MDLAIAIRIGSPNSSLKLLKGTVESIQKNVGQCSYRFLLSLDPKIPAAVKEYIYEKQKTEPEHFQVLHEKTVYWSEFINEAIEKAADFDYFIKAHDDIELHTPDFFPTVKKMLGELKKPVAWISFDLDAYLVGGWTTPTRPGFFSDYLYEKAWPRGKMFQFHNLPNGWWQAPWYIHWPYWFEYKLTRVFKSLKPWRYPRPTMSEANIKLLDFPPRPVKAHGPWNAFVMVPMKALKNIGPCTHWQTYNALLVDEDWGLRALQKGYQNIWIPSVKYFHVPLDLETGGNRSQEMVGQQAERVHNEFVKKWGFHLPTTEDELKMIKEKYAGTNIPWSIDRKSYDWDYAE